MDVEQALSDVLARQAIHDLIMTQARASDRNDLTLLGSVWHPDATVDAGGFKGSAADYWPMILEATAGVHAMSHNITNVWIDVRGDQAVAESYVLAIICADDEHGDAVSEMTAGRYLDSFSQRGGPWKFDTRQFVSDWHQSFAAASDASEIMADALQNRGERGPADPVFAHWATVE